MVFTAADLIAATSQKTHRGLRAQTITVDQVFAEICRAYEQPCRRTPAGDR